jgi:hypothetical protein
VIARGVTVGVLVAVVMALAAVPATGQSLYPLLKQNVVVGADAWSRKPAMLAAGLGFVNILGVPDADSADLSVAQAAVQGVGGAWNVGLTCPSDSTPPQRAFTSANSPQQIATTFGVQTLYGAGLPVEFSWPVLPSTVDPTDFAVTLSDGSRVTPDASSITPNYEYNERSTVVLIGQFGNSIPETSPGSLYATKVEVVEDSSPMKLVGPGNHLASAVGLSATKSTSPYDVVGSDPTSWTGPRLTGGKITRMSTRGEQAPVGLRGNLPNDGVALYGKKARFRIRVLTTGGFSPDGIRGLYPTDYRRFFQVWARSRGGQLVKLVKPRRTYLIDGHPLRVLGLADLGRKQGSYDPCYSEDHDNQIDIVLAGSIKAAKRVRFVVIPAQGGGYQPFYNPGGPGMTPVASVDYTAPGPRFRQPIANALRNPLTVTYRPK